jgi:4-amino-4-deoxy-L-arabinose transferase-like glycosyltransferase
MSSRSQILLLLVIIGVALTARLVLAHYETEVGIDSVHYVLMGDNIAHGRAWDTWNTTGGRWILPPAFPLLIALFRFLGVGLEWSGHLASVFAGTLLLLPIYFLTKRLYGRDTAILAAWIAAFTPILVDYSVVILTECLFAALLLTMVIFVHRAFSEKGSSADSFWSGLFLGLAFLTKTLGIMFLPFLILGYLLSRKGQSLAPPFKQASLAFVGFLVLAVPYWVVLHAHTGQWVIDGKGVGQENRLYARNLEEEHIDPRYSGVLTPDGSDFLINSPQEEIIPAWATPGNLASNFTKKYLLKLVRIYQDYPFTPTYPNSVLLFYLFPAILLGLGLFSGNSSWKYRKSDRFLLFWLCPFIFGFPLVFIEVRYYIACVPFLIPFMAVGAMDLTKWINERFSKNPTAPSSLCTSRQMVIVALIFLILALPKLTYKITHWNDPFVSYNPRAVAAQWLSNNGYHPEKIMEYGHSVSFYSGAQSILFPAGNLDDLIRIAHKYNIDLLSLDEYYLHQGDRRPNLNFLLNSKTPPPPPLKLIYSDERYPGLHHYIYQIEDTQPQSSQ